MRSEHIRAFAARSERLLGLVPALCALGVGATTLLAAEVTLAGESGSYEQVVSLLTNYTKSERGAETVIGGSSSGTVTTTRSSGGLFVEGSNGTFDCIIFAKKTSAGMDLEAPCTSTDASGDKQLSVARRRQGDVSAGGGGEGRSELVGGTGKYQGITGSCTYKVDYLPGNRLVSISKCQWQKP